jgi:hypothetical protein
MIYYLTIEKNSKELYLRKPFKDYSSALEECAKFYVPKAGRSLLAFTTETINGKFARTYAELNRPEHIDLKDTVSKIRYEAAVKQANAFEYTDSYFFLIESEVGVKDADEDEDED